jgi:parvulin-like peptidyl-prolyl isomerase
VPVVVNGERIEDRLIREEARAIRPKLEEAMAGEDPRAIEARIKQWARENIIERVLLQQAALADAEPVSEEEIEQQIAEIRPENGGCIAPGTEAQVRQEIELRFRIDRLFNRVCAHLADPRNKDISEFYRKHRDNFQSEEMLHAAHIVKNIDDKQDEATARSGIESAMLELKAGSDFAETADRLSDCPGRGGDLGWFPRGQMVDEFDAVAFNLAPGQTSDIFRTPFGFHIARAIEFRPAGPLPLEDVKDQISQTLMQEKRQKLIEQYLDKLWSAAKIEDVAS